MKQEVRIYRFIDRHDIVIFFKGLEWSCNLASLSRSMDPSSGVLDIDAIEDQSLDLLSPVSLSSVVSRSSSTPAKKESKTAASGLLDAFDEIQGDNEDLLL
jgi:hypothetical protein